MERLEYVIVYWILITKIEAILKKKDFFSKGRKFFNWIQNTGKTLEKIPFQNLWWSKLNIEENGASSRCLKITEKVSFNIASEASYVYILSGQKLF